MSEYKKYYWNRNAATHRDALIKFGWFAFFPAGILAMFISLAVQPAVRTAESYRLSAIVLVVVFVVVYCLVFGLFTWFYWALNQEQFRPYSPPTPETTTKIIPIFHNGKEAAHMEYKTGKGGKS